ncbi:MAG: pilus assembly protein [Acidimicrobiia bacterium]|nr:pilus assembly protein [Acidimicrobiia bacterium]
MDRRASERGTAIVEFLGVTLLIVAALMMLMQMALWIWARNVTVNAADEGARAAAEMGRPLADGAARTRSVLHDGLGGRAARFAIGAEQDGDAVVVRVSGVAPHIVPFLPEFVVSAEARALDEDTVVRP